MPVSTLRCTGMRAGEAEGGGGALRWLRCARRWRWPGVRSVAQHGVFFAAPEAGHDEDGQLDAGFANGDSFFGGGDAEPDGSGLFQGAGAIR